MARVRRGGGPRAEAATPAPDSAVITNSCLLLPPKIQSLPSNHLQKPSEQPGTTLMEEDQSPWLTTPQPAPPGMVAIEDFYNSNKFNKRKILTTGMIDSIMTDNEEIEIVNSFSLFGSTINSWHQQPGNKKTN